MVRPGVDFADVTDQPSRYIIHRLVAFRDDADALSDRPRCDWMIPGHHDYLQPINGG